MEMKISRGFEFVDLQGLLRFGYGKLTDTCFMLLNVINVDLAKQWLNTAPINSAITTDSPPSIVFRQVSIFPFLA